MTFFVPFYVHSTALVKKEVEMISFIDPWSKFVLMVCQNLNKSLIECKNNSGRRTEFVYCCLCCWLFVLQNVSPYNDNILFKACLSTYPLIHHTLITLMICNPIIYLPKKWRKNQNVTHYLFDKKWKGAINATSISICQENEDKSYIFFIFDSRFF